MILEDNVPYIIDASCETLDLLNDLTYSNGNVVVSFKYNLGNAFLVLYNEYIIPMGSKLTKTGNILNFELPNEKIISVSIKK